MKEILGNNLHQIQLKEVKLVHMSSSTDIEPVEGENIRVQTQIATKGEMLTNYKGRTMLKTEVRGYRSEQEVLNIEVIYVGICEAEECIDKKEWEVFLEVQAVPMLWSYTRETIQNICSKMGYYTIILPVLNITQLIQEMMGQKEG